MFRAKIKREIFDLDIQISSLQNHIKKLEDSMNLIVKAINDVKNTQGSFSKELPLLQKAVGSLAGKHGDLISNLGVLTNEINLLKTPVIKKSESKKKTK